ncbi:unnamed protein product [Pleuronectes platessa]|uniref:Uncharacterized protein n=1 Tax=Pleuronectes platessa TaxID=8262 RepID=A0A9N7UR20_PLEPL|nr:unnamed protein product [Pleuronectes platessa]
MEHLGQQEQRDSEHSHNARTATTKDSKKSNNTRSKNNTTRTKDRTEAYIHRGKEGPIKHRGAHLGSVLASTDWFLQDMQPDSEETDPLIEFHIIQTSTVVTSHLPLMYKLASMDPADSAPLRNTIKAHREKIVRQEEKIPEPEG